MSTTTTTMTTYVPILPSTSRVTYTRCLRSMTATTTDVPERKELWGTRRFVCNDCKRKFALKAYLVRHQMFDCNNKRKRRGRANAKSKSPSSNNCSTTISATETTTTTTTTTTSTTSTMSATEQGKNIRYICPKCHRTYMFLTSLKRHQNCECGVEPQFTCPICKKKYSQKGNLTRHLRTLH
ncbi:zinc finger protein 84-like [Polistes fuscatus]|uniref:zinc finger protein 84-like n=1 Tax=Polistes fuscatus TaxID=30207 RepID=UPI001CA7EB94|nr:zinc finger protein 84-like [Polistes fuscatus]